MSSGTLSAIIGLLLMVASGSAHGRVTGITFEPRSPIVGQTVTAIATDDRKHVVTEWTWGCNFADVGSVGPTSIKPVDPGRAALKLLCGGTYMVSVRVTYGGPMPPPPETVSVSLVVARPDDLEIIVGIDHATRYLGPTGASTLKSQVRSRGTKVGEHLLGMAQGRIRNRTWWDGKTDPDETWRPAAPGPRLFQQEGVIESWVMFKIEPGDWRKIRAGRTVVSWDEDVRLVYGIGAVRREGEYSTHGTAKYAAIECPLRTLSLSIVKVDESHWVVREGVQAGEQPGLP